MSDYLQLWLAPTIPLTLVELAGEISRLVGVPLLPPHRHQAKDFV